MCDCFDVSDFVCFLTFFITAIVALFFVQYFFVYLNFESDDRTRTEHLYRSMYFLILTLLGCLVFAGVQRRSISLLKWPSRLLVALIASGLIFLTAFLWTLDKVHKKPVRNLEIKSVKLSCVIILLFLYLIGVQKLIKLIRMSNSNIDYEDEEEDQDSILIENFKAIYNTTAQNNAVVVKQFNADSNGVNHYKVLLEPNNFNEMEKRFFPLAKFVKSKGHIITHV